jgi:hypothetical protein
LNKGKSICVEQESNSTKREGILDVVQVVSPNTFASIDEVFLDNFQELLV